MHIKRIEIQGFKTFADRTVLELTSGITAIVGPNGTGKSNIADAVMWVLGEQNVRNLRGTRSQDVIFSGSDRRRPLGMAEVSLTIDNSCGTLPLEFAEITVARRVYRSGEGEYFLNKTACRLKDIYELFLDTGMGHEAYSMVSQGEIDAILSARSEDRRVLFEEAAGIKKYQHRRKEAVKKLEATEGNLRRVNDIVVELSDQIEPLAEQAEVARRCDDLVSRLREIETGLLINDLTRWSAEFERLRQAKAGGTERIAEQDRRIADLEWEKDKLSTQLADLDPRVESARSRHQEAAAAAQQVRSRLALVEQRQRTSEETRRRLESEIEQLERRIEETRARLERLESELAGCSERESRLAADVADRSKALEETVSELESTAAIAEDRKAAYLELARNQAAKRAELESLRTRVTELETAAAKYAAELQSLELSLTETVQQHEQESERAQEIRSRDKTRGDELPTLRAKRNAFQAKIASGTEKLAGMNHAAAEKSSRLATLSEMAEAHEGFYEGVRSVMAARKAGKLAGGYAVVADVISVPRGLELAIDAALGGAVQDIISDTADDAKAAIRFLKENRAGRATFLPLDGIRPAAGRKIDLRGAGVHGIASRLVSFDQKHSAAIDLLLGGVLVIDHIDNAVAYARKKTGWARIVTLDGEVIAPTGAMTGGAGRGRGPSLLGRKQEIDSLSGELSALDAARTAAEKELASARKALAKADGRIEELERESAADLLSLVETERQIEFLAQEQRRVQAQMEVVRLEEEEARAALAEDSAALAALESVLSAAGRENVDLDELVAGAQKKLEELTSRRESLSEELMEMSVTLASVRERRAGIEQSIQQTGTAVADMESELAGRSAEIERQKAGAAEDEENHTALAAEIRSASDALETAHKELDGLVSQRTELAQSAAAVDAELKSLNHARSETAELIRDSDVREARLEVQIAQTSERLFLEYEIAVEEALAHEGPVEVARGTATEVGALRKEIRAMGAVNTGAVQEYERISERWEFLMTQKTDLERARETLLDAIREIDAGTKDLFMTTFRAVEEHFDGMFRRLFGGGKAELVLTDPSNLLETGVEVIVQLPGKKLQNLVLLSGGERALTASALLFALLMARPSPFVVLDEVDAPLDDANIERFVEVVREFAENAQFVIVTHNRATMEASDTLYGITMDEPGVSKLISVRLAEEAEKMTTGAEVLAPIPAGPRN